MLPMLWGIAAVTLFGAGPMDRGVPSPVVNGKTLETLDAMPAMLSQILHPGVKGIVVAGMLAATMSVNSSYLLGWSSIISQDVVLPMRRLLHKQPLSSRAQIVVNRAANWLSVFFSWFGVCTKTHLELLNLTLT